MPSSPGSKERTAIRKKIEAKVAEHKAQMAEIEEMSKVRELTLAKTFCGRCKLNKLECNCGAPLLLEEEPEKLALLRDAFKLGSSDRDACIFAGISPAALQNYIKSHPKFAVEKEQMKLMPLLKAKQNVIGAIGGGNLQQSNWYLERKQRDEFGMKQEVEHSGQITHGVVVLPTLAPIGSKAGEYVDADAELTEEKE